MTQIPKIRTQYTIWSLWDNKSFHFGTLSGGHYTSDTSNIDWKNRNAITLTIKIGTGLTIFLFLRKVRAVKKVSKSEIIDKLLPEFGKFP